MNVVKIEKIENRVITIRGKKVLIDGNIAEVCGVETKRVNEGVEKISTSFLWATWLNSTKARTTNWSKISTGSIG